MSQFVSYESLQCLLQSRGKPTRQNKSINITLAGFVLARWLLLLCMWCASMVGSEICDKYHLYCSGSGAIFHFQLCLYIYKVRFLFS